MAKALHYGQTEHFSIETFGTAEVSNINPEVVKLKELHGRIVH